MKVLRTTDTPESSFEDRGEVRVVLASAPAGPASGAIGVLRCKNYGCQVEFDVRRAPHVALVSTSAPHEHAARPALRLEGAPRLTLPRLRPAAGGDQHGDLVPPPHGRTRLPRHACAAPAAAPAATPAAAPAAAPARVAPA